MRTTLFALFTLFLTVTLASSQDEWEVSNNGISAAFIDDIEFSEDGVPLLMTGHGLYRLEAVASSQGERMRWRLINRKIHGGELIRSPGGGLYAQTGIDSVYYSGDDGNSWTWLWIEPIHKPLFVDDSTLAGYTGSAFTHIVVRGDSIVSIDRSFSNFAINLKLMPSGRDLIGFYPPFYPGADTSMMQTYRSTDRGLTWLAKDHDIGFDDLVISASGRWIGANVNGCYISDDSGSTWSKTTTLRLSTMVPSTEGCWYATFPSDPQDLDTRTKLARSTDDGESWRIVSDRAPREIAVGPDGRLWGESWNKMFLSSDGGVTWQEQSEGLHNIYVDALFYVESNKAHYAFVNRNTDIGLDDSRYSLYRSGDGGASWSLAADSVSLYFEVDAAGGIYILKDSLFPMTWESVPGDTTDGLGSWSLLLRSSDQGLTWRKVPKHISLFGSVVHSPDKESPWIDVASNRNGRIVVNALWYDTTGTGMNAPGFHYLSVDSGASWSRLEFDEPFASSNAPCVAAIDDDGQMFMISYNPRLGIYPPLQLWRSDTSGRNVRRIEDEPPLYRVVVGGSGRLYGIGSDLYLSEDGGEHWRMIYDTDDTLMGVRIVTKDSLIGESMVSFDLIYLQEHRSFDMKVRSHDGGRTWQRMGVATGTWLLADAVSTKGHLSMFHHIHRINYELNADLFTDALLISSDFGETWVYAGGEMRDRWARTAVYDSSGGLLVGTWGDGLYRMPATPVTSGVLETANDVGTIKISSGTASEVVRLTLSEFATGTISIDLFDSFGRRLSSRDVDVTAVSEIIVFELGDLPTGIYYCRIRLNDTIRTVPFSLLQ